MLKSGDRIRIWSSHGADGSAYVEDGLIPAANHHETGWMERCDTRWASDLNFVSSHPGAERDEIKVAQTSAERWLEFRGKRSRQVGAATPERTFWRRTRTTGI